jgi:hypothetical protein
MLYNQISLCYNNFILLQSMPRFKPENIDKNYKVFEVVLMQWRQEKVAGHPNLHWLGFTTGK